MKKLILLLFLILIVPNILAISLDVQKTSSDEVLILDLNAPVTIDLSITNNGASGSFEFYNLLGFIMDPVERVAINSGETKEIQLKLTPIGNIKTRGYFDFSYFIRAQDNSEIEENVIFKIIELKDAFEVGSGEVDPESQTMDIYIKNLESVDFGSIDVKFSSALYNSYIFL